MVLQMKAEGMTDEEISAGVLQSSSILYELGHRTTDKAWEELSRRVLDSEFSDYRNGLNDLVEKFEEGPSTSGGGDTGRELDIMEGSCECLTPGSFVR